MALWFTSMDYASPTETYGNSGIWRPPVAADATGGWAAVIFTWIWDVKIQAPGPESGQDFGPPRWKSLSKSPLWEPISTREDRKPGTDTTIVLDWTFRTWSKMLRRSESRVDSGHFIGCWCWNWLLFLILAFLHFKGSLNTSCYSSQPLQTLQCCHGNQESVSMAATEETAYGSICTKTPQKRFLYWWCDHNFR